MSEYLYRIWGDNDELLYIGISKSALRRFAEHLETQPWAAEIRNVTVESLDCDRNQALAIERRAIVAERPIYNKTHNLSQRMSRTKKERWMCMGCHAPAAYIQYIHKSDGWLCVCKDCDPCKPPKTSDIYWLDCDEYQDDYEVRRLVDYLREEKEWMDIRSWNLMVQWCRDRTPSRARSIASLRTEPQAGHYVILPLATELPKWTINQAGRILGVRNGDVFTIETISFFDGLFESSSEFAWNPSSSWKLYDDKEAWMLSVAMYTRRYFRQQRRAA